MGWHVDTGFAAGDDVAKAFNEMVESQRHEYGYGGENGSIGQCYTYEVVCRTPLTHREAGRITMEAAEPETDGYGLNSVAYAAPVASDEHFSTRTRKIKVELPLHDFYSHELLLEAIKPKLTLKPGERVAEIRVASRQAVAKPAVTRTEGKPVKSYLVVRKGTLQQVRGTTPAASLAEARKQMMASIKTQLSQRHGYPEDVEIIGIERRASGEGLVVGSPQITAHKLELEAVIVKPKASLKVRGWYFAGFVNS